METTYLLLSDGTCFKGQGFGFPAPVISSTSIFNAGELVFNTSMTGYSEILTDPSYNGQLVLLTYPLIGNYGVDDIWSESDSMKATALIVKKLYKGELPEGRISLDEAMKKEKISGIEGIDTRALTLHLREHGSQNAILYRGDEHELALKRLREFPSITERDLIEGVSVKQVVNNPTLGEGFSLPPTKPSKHLAVVDFGIKKSIISNFYKRNIAVTLLPPTFTGKEVLDGEYDGLFLSNGPGDPALLQPAIAEIKQVIGKKPVLGICLGHQLITWALGGKTTKMKYGHHGANHPVKNLETGSTFVTSQNHGFMTDKKTLPKEVTVWFENANDHTIEGIYHAPLKVRSVQFHPEACPGPMEAEAIFNDFIKELD